MNTTIRRTILGLPIWLLAATAVAAFVFTLHINGNVTVSSGEVAYNTGGGVVTNSGTCTGTYPDDRRLDLTWSPAFGGDTCQIVVSFRSKSNDVAMRLQGVRTPSGITATLGDDCGKTLQAHPDPATPAATVNLAISSEMTSGEVIDFTADTFGFDWVPSTSYDAGACT